MSSTHAQTFTGACPAIDSPLHGADVDEGGAEWQVWGSGAALVVPAVQGDTGESLIVPEAAGAGNRSRLSGRYLAILSLSNGNTGRAFPVHSKCSGK